MSIEELIGEYTSYGVAYSTDVGVRKEAASGGLVSTLLITMLRRGFIDGALVVRNDGLEQKGVLARTEDEVMAAAGSKYLQMPFNLGEVMRTEGRFAVVGLPCHLRGLRKLEAFYPKLREKIVLRIGLFCGHTITHNGMAFILNEIDINPNEIAELKYRAKMQNTTGLYIRTKDGRERFIPLSTYWGKFFNFFFIPDGCMSCEDQTAECSDISVGDAWAFREGAKRRGLSLFITRNEAGEKALRLSVSEGLAKVMNVEPEVVVRPQKYNLLMKKWKYLGGFNNALGCTCRTIQFILNSASKFKACYPILKIWIRLILSH